MEHKEQQTIEAVIDDRLAHLDFGATTTPLPDKFGHDYKALHELAHCQREIEARCLDAMAVTHGDEAECALEFLTMRRDRFPSDDEQR